ncbi:MAG: hypothetical protein OHK0029_30030 [Armatimonadaceae bacterium]
MSIKTLVLGGVLIITAVLTYAGFLIAFPWEYYQVGDYAVRRNKVTGIATVRYNDQWSRFDDDVYADPLPPEVLKRLRVDKLIWGQDGLLLGTVTNRLADPVEGRLAFRIVIRDRKDRRFIKDRSLRATVSFPPNRPVPFILRTGLSTPDPKKTYTELEIQPVNFSGL